MMDILAESLLREGYDGVSLHQFRILDKVREGLARPSQLARLLGVSPPAVTVLLERLEGMGLLRRTSSIRDRRQVDLDLTDEGEELVRKVNARRRALVKKVLAGMEKEDLERMGPGLAAFQDSYRRLRDERKV